MRIAYVLGARPNFVKMAPVTSGRSRIPSLGLLDGQRYQSRRGLLASCSRVPL